MNPKPGRYMTLIEMDLRLTLRNRSALFMSCVFPLIFFFFFGWSFHAGQGKGVSTFVVSYALVMGILTNGLIGTGVRATQEREQGILRRFRVAPITPLPLLVASLVTGWVLYLPLLLLVVGLAHGLYGMPLPLAPVSLLITATAGLLAFRALGLIVASVVNSTQEGQLLTQLLFMPLVFQLSLPASLLPEWARLLTQFLPTTHLQTGIQAVLLRGESVLALPGPVLALLGMTGLALFISVKLFRWEKEEKLPAASKLWVAAVLVPFFVYGAWQVHQREQLRSAEAFFHALQRDQALLISGARIFVGDGTVIERGSVLVREGRIARVFEEGHEPEAQMREVPRVDATGKTLLPGLIDVHVHLGAMAMPPLPQEGFDPERHQRQVLRSFLYAGVTAVRSVGDSMPEVVERARRLSRLEEVGPELFADGPLFTTEGGHGTEYAQSLPEPLKTRVLEATVRLPKTPEEARAQVDALKREGVVGIKGVLDAGPEGLRFQRMEVPVLRAVAEQAHADGLPVAIHTGDAHDVADALELGADSIEHGSARDALPDALLQRMAGRSVAYDPTLAVIDAFARISSGGELNPLLEDALVRQLVPPARVENARTVFTTSASFRKVRTEFAPARDNLVRAWKAGVPLVTGTDAGNPLVVPGASLHRELRLWVEAGLPPTVALQAATSGAAHLLRAEDRMGRIQQGYEANLLLVDGNPLEDISVTEKISLVLFKGEKLERSELPREEEPGHPEP